MVLGEGGRKAALGVGQPAVALLLLLLPLARPAGSAAGIRRVREEVRRPRLEIWLLGKNQTLDGSASPLHRKHASALFVETSVPKDMRFGWSAIWHPAFLDWVGSLTSQSACYQIPR